MCPYSDSPIILRAHAQAHPQYSKRRRIPLLGTEEVACSFAISGHIQFQLNERRYIQNFL